MCALVCMCVLCRVCVCVCLEVKSGVTVCAAVSMLVGTQPALSAPEGSGILDRDLLGQLRRDLPSVSLGAKTPPQPLRSTMPFPQLPIQKEEMVLKLTGPSLLGLMASGQVGSCRGAFRSLELRRLESGWRHFLSQGSLNHICSTPL